jgi:hypothetical protein
MGRDRIIEATMRFLTYINVPATREDILEATDVSSVAADMGTERIIGRNIFAALSKSASPEERKNILTKDVPVEQRKFLLNAWESWTPK